MATASVPGPSKIYFEEVWLPDGTKTIYKHYLTTTIIVGYTSNSDAQAAADAATTSGVTASVNKDGPVFYSVTIETDVISSGFQNILVITFDADGGTDPSPASKNVIYSRTYGTLATTSRASYVFSGWFTEINGGGDEITAGSTVDITEDTTLFAKWIAE